jgi:hypothetical protein
MLHQQATGEGCLTDEGCLSEEVKGAGSTKLLKEFCLVEQRMMVLLESPRRSVKGESSVQATARHSVPKQFVI